jgi:hypothetical protein
MVRYTLVQHGRMYYTYVKYAPVRKYRREFRHKFYDERVPSKQRIHNLVNKLRRGLLTLSGQMSIYNRNRYSSAMDKCRYMIEIVSFAVLRSYFIRTLVVGTVCYTNVFRNGFPPSSCHLEVIV